MTDAAGIACIDQPGVGAMGIHYLKGAVHQVEHKRDGLVLLAGEAVSTKISWW